jgi:REP element-mobilizing transposase RayT
MPKPRRQLVSLEATAYYHCISRCVRRAFLCGHDPLTGKTFDHRKQWIADRMRQLAAIFAIDICSYGLLSNHFHVILHIDRPRALAWTEEQVAARYAKLFPHTVKTARTLSAPAWAQKVACWRQRLGDLSWFMRCLNEAIARRANREDHCTGRFWEGRFRSQALLDAGALVTCMTYVDLNPIRAGLATTLEESAFTSIQERLQAAARGKSGPPAALVPFADQGSAGGDPLPVSFPDYVEVLRWTAASLIEPRSDAGPAHVKAALERLDLESAGFVASVRQYARSFFTMVGQVHRIDVESRRRGYQRRPGIRAARQLYRAAAA